MAKILTVDDDREIVRLLSRILTREGYEVLTALDGKECLAMAARERPGLILLDINMPGMDGGEVLRALKEDGVAGNIPVIFLTGIVTEEEARKSRIGGQAYISKYSDPVELVRRVKELLAPDPGAREPLPPERDPVKVMVVDDNPDILGLLGRFLAKKGYVSLTASSGEEALERMLAEHPGVVLLDIRLPGIDGLATLKRIKEMSASTQVIMITGVGDENNASAALRLGASEYIVKPIDLNYLTLSLQTTSLK